MPCTKTTFVVSTLGFATLGFATLLTGTLPALAADLLPPPPPPQMEIRQSTYDWGGVYVGGLIGVGSVDNTFVPIGSPDPEVSGSGLIGGIMGGYNFQINEFVVGAEADIMFTDIHNKNTASGVDQKFSYLSTIRARAGWAHDNTLFYATAGIGFIRSKFHVLPADESVSKTHMGYVVGGGIEHAISQSLVVRGEYLYGSFGKKNYVYTPGTIRTGIDNLHIARAGFAYKF